VFRLAQLLRSKPVIWFLLVLPGLWPIWPLYVRQDPSALADGLKFILLHLGFVTSVLLAAVLTFSPLRVLFPKWPVALALNRHRRLVGVSVFGYGLLHFIAHVLYEGGPAEIGATMKTALEKPFLLTGLIALSILLVLAATSFNGVVRALGGKLWKNIHRFVYIAAGLVVYHQIEAKKIFPMEVVWIFGPVALLEIARLVKHRGGKAERE
jgi:methionine sulfoxide reductase heme-binding subunit